MVDGTRSTDLPLVGYLDEFIGNTDSGSGKSTGRATAASIAAQLTINNQLSTLLPIKSVAISTPPVSPTLGDAYIVASGGSGAWASHDDDVAKWNGTEWIFTVPTEGMSALVTSEGTIYFWDAATSAWAPIIGDLLLPSWTLLDGITGTKVGQKARVKGDGGTHTDPVNSAAGTSNSGEFSWQTSPATGWLRIGDNPLEAADLADDFAAMRSAGARSSDFSALTYDAATADLLTVGTTAYYGSLNVAKSDEYITGLNIRVNAAGAGMLAIVDQAGKLLSETSVALGSSGFNAVTLDPPVFRPGGAYAFWRQTSGARLRYDNTTGKSVASVVVGSWPSVGGVAPITIVGSVEIAFEIEAEAVDKTIAARAQESQDKIDEHISALSTSARTSRPATTFLPSGSGIQKAASGWDAGVDIPAGGLITHIVADLLAYAGVDHFVVALYERDTTSGSINTAPPVSGVDTLISSRVVTPTEAGLTVGAASFSKALFKIPEYVAKAGKTYAAAIKAMSSLHVGAVMGLGYTTGPETRQRAKGWYAGAGAFSNFGAGLETSVGLLVQTTKKAARKFDGVIEQFSDASATIDGLDVAVQAKYESVYAAPRFVGTTLTFTAAAAGKKRYDLIYFEPEAKTFGVIAGTERTTDAAEFLPTVGATQRLPLFNVRVDETSVTDVIPLWNIDRNGDPREIVESLEAERRRSRSCLSKLIAKIRRGDQVHILGMGDSILAIQSGVPSGGTTTPNGPERDRATAYLGAPNGVIGADVVSALPLYTSVGLGVGRADDGAGAVHTKFGHVWELVTAIQALGNTVIYDNFAIGGTKTDDMLTAGVPNEWVTNAIARAPDVVVLNDGTNELGGAATASNMAIIAQAFIDAGIDVIIIGAPRPNPANTAHPSRWYYTNRALASAAKFVGAAFVPTVGIYDERYIGAIGISKLDAAKANDLNHPGIIEQKVMGRQVKEIVLGAL